ncbi:altronate hydrolase [Shouchella clausii]|uniref:UxaA family hydrolase n=1 Tax=Shouchella tritolerans TaxID=2979466 RepID=UPI001B019A76|nr:UxaA family hydrolase [Shouchella tritolerans]GIN14109.1 altronate hydrolase [Shouchella clausii]
MSETKTHVVMQQKDNVATALRDFEKGHVVTIDGEKPLHLKNNIDFGHKFALYPIKKGADITKYGEVIGVASTDIAVGEHVHLHNVEGKRGRGDQRV